MNGPFSFFVTACAALHILKDNKTNTNKSERNRNSEIHKSEQENAVEETKPEITMRLANAYPEGDIKDLAARRFSEVVKEKSNGKINIEVYSSSILGDWQDIVDGLELGVYQIAISPISEFVSRSVKANIDIQPYIFRDFEHFMRVWSSPFGEEMKMEIGRDADIVFLGNMYRGARQLFSNWEINNVEDLNGMPMRVPPLDAYFYTWETLGTAPIAITLYNTYTALESGVVEGQENSMSESYNLGFGEVTDYLVKTNHVRNLDVFALNREYFEGLPNEWKEVLIESANEVSDWRNSIIIEFEEQAERDLVEQGMTVIDVDTKPFEEKLKDFTKDYYPELLNWVETIEKM